MLDDGDNHDNEDDEGTEENDNHDNDGNEDNDNFTFDLFLRSLHINHEAASVDRCLRTQLVHCLQHQHQDQDQDQDQDDDDHANYVNWFIIMKMITHEPDR